MSLVGIIKQACCLLAAVVIAGATTQAVAEGNDACPDTAAVARDLVLIDDKGGLPGSVNLLLNPRVLALARCANANGDAIAAETVVEALLSYASVIRKWPILDRAGRPDDAPDWTYWNFGGFWGGEWIFVDLERSARLARAYELVARSGAVSRVAKRKQIDADRIIREELLRYLIDQSLRFGRGATLRHNTGEAYFTFYNMDPLRLRDMAVFGRTVDPAYTHIAVHLLRNFPRVGFLRDGVWHEGTVSYHHQLLDYLGRAMRELRGYSDPPGYVFSGQYVTLFGDRYLGVPGRFDNLDPEGDQAPAFARIRSAVYPLTWPDGRMVTRNDTHFNARGDPRNAPKASQCLLGLRHCILVAGAGHARTIVHLTFGGTEGHEHLDKLHMDLWSAERLFMSDGDYWKVSPRNWNKSTLAHNTVTIDYRNQHNRHTNERILTELDLIEGIGHHTWQGYGHGNTTNLGNLLAADLQGGPVQYVVADAHRVYDRAGDTPIYERLLLLATTSSDLPYVLDVFRVRGGQRHTWMQHGDLGAPYGLHADLPLTPSDKPVSLYLVETQRGETRADWRSEIELADGAKLVTHHLQARPAKIALARGPSHAPTRRSQYLAIEEAGPDSVFVKVHDVSGDGRAVTKVELTRSATLADQPIGVRVLLSDGRQDEISVGWLDGPALAGGEARVRLISRNSEGRCALRYGGDQPHAGRAWQSGLVSAHEADGKTPASIVLNASRDEIQRTPQLVHLRLPDGVVQSYRVTRLSHPSAGLTALEIEGLLGLKLIPPSPTQKRWVTKHTTYPSSGYWGLPTWRVTYNALLPCTE